MSQFCGSPARRPWGFHLISHPNASIDSELHIASIPTAAIHGMFKEGGYEPVTFGWPVRVGARQPGNGFTLHWRADKNYSMMCRQSQSHSSGKLSAQGFGFS